MSVELTTLANGFRIVSERMPSLASAALGVWIDAGARHEREDENGVAHFLEHMAFKGTARRSARAIAEEIEDVGGYLNAYTSRERTAYFARVLEEDVPLALDLLADILLNPALAEAEIEVERGVILQEIGQVHDTPDDLIFDWLQETAYPAQPMGRAILGPAERIRRVGRADLGGFIGRHYRPERMILSAAGAVDHGRLVRLAEAAFGDMGRGAGEPVEPARFQGGERRETKPLEQAHFALALDAPGYREPDYYAAQIAATALGGGMSSRLFQEARERRGLCYSIFAQCSSWIDSGLLMIYAGTGGAELRGLIDLTADEMRRAAEGLTEQEVARARAQIRAGLVMGLESPSARAERMAGMLAIWDRVPPLEESVASIEAVGVREARAAVARFAASPPALALLGPVEGAGTLEELAERLAA
ncbi:MAG TPA: pitrilysin family protein [Thermohalobaculum sp.]|nr:pitrilysin family protein [Thermohalobaculum sp.]